MSITKKIEFSQFGLGCVVLTEHLRIWWTLESNHQFHAPRALRMSAPELMLFVPALSPVGPLMFLSLGLLVASSIWSQGEKRMILIYNHALYLIWVFVYARIWWLWGLEIAR